MTSAGKIDSGPPTPEALERLGRERLSPNFFMRDFLYSETAALAGLVNYPVDVEQALAVSRKLCVELLEPLQTTFGRLEIRSAYRSPRVNAYGNAQGWNCASNESSHAAHIWDVPDKEGRRGGMACIVIPLIADLFARDRSVWRRIAWYIHDQLPYDRMTFHPNLCAINLGWSDKPRRIVQSHIRDGGPAFPKPGEPDHSGNHSKEYRDLPPLKRTAAG
jgi:hypothetical protein